MNNIKRLIFKIGDFPNVSETFIIAQIISAINQGFDVKILVNKFNNIDTFLHKNKIYDYHLQEKIIEEKVNIPKNKIIRVFRIVFLLSRYFTRIKDIINFYKHQPSNKKSISWVFYWVFYNQFNHKNTVFHVQYGNNKYPLDILKVKCNYKPKLIFTFHGHDAFFPMYGYIPNNGYYDLLFKSASLITANTPYLAEKILALNCPSEKLKIIPVGVDLTFFTPKEKSNNDKKLKIVTVGRLAPEKGHRIGVSIVNRLVKSGLNVTFSIVGEGPEKNSLEKLIEDNELKSNVFLLGQKSQEEIREILWNNDLYMFTALPLPDGRRETQGLATLEAQACGLPVVAFDSGGIKYTIAEGKTGFIFKEYDEEGVLNILHKIYYDRDILTEMSIETPPFLNQKYAQIVIDKIWENEYNTIFNQ